MEDRTLSNCECCGFPTWKNPERKSKVFVCGTCVNVYHGTWEPTTYTLPTRAETVARIDALILERYGKRGALNPQKSHLYSS